MILRSFALAGLLATSALAQDESTPFAPFDASRELRAEANRALEAGDIGAARRALEAADGLQPGHPGILLGLAQAGLASGDTDLLFEGLERFAAAGLAFDLARLGENEARLREADPDRYAALDALLTRNRGSVGQAETAATITQANSLIEGVAKDIETDRIFVSDVIGRQVLVIEPFDRNAHRVFANAESGLQSVFGLAVDDVNRVVWATSGAVPQTPLDEGEAATTALLALDLASGELYRRFEADGAERFADLVTRDGMVWLIDSGANAVYQLSSLTAELRLLSDDPRFASLQGAALADGALYVADYALGLWRVDLADGDAQLVTSGEESLIGLDGLSATRDGRLIAIRNGVNPHAVIAIDLDDTGLAVEATEVLLRGHAAFGEPTLLDVQDDRIFLVANAPWALWPEAGGGPTEAVPPTIILEIDLD